MMENFFNHSIGFAEYITGNRFIDICNDGTATFCKTDFLSMTQIKEGTPLVTHNSDYCINEKRRDSQPKVTKWFAQNKECKDDSVVPIPIGLENMQLRTAGTAQNGVFSSEVKGALEKGLLLDKINSYEISKDGLAYLNFNSKTYPEERVPLWDRFSNQDWVSTASSLTLQQFYFDMATHKFIFSPRGNGIDCHRTWEALYLRTIPIVKRCTHMDAFDELPILFVNEWSEISYNYLSTKYDEYRDRLFDLSKMKISYWRKRINDCS
tara:strand:+ start:6974 stop:7771 length:798 start_codon:yes stop_codon:yes gene_type:complete